MAKPPKSKETPKDEAEHDERYLKIVVDPIRVCAKYEPRFGQGAQGSGLSLEQFQKLYGADPFYSWFGLENPLMYAAHKAAGGMTSIYRQIGSGCEKLIRVILKDNLGLSDDDVNWSYQIPGSPGKTRTLSLDGRIPLHKIADPGTKKRVKDWMTKAAKDVGVAPKIIADLSGPVFEIRQGYKSKDAKRQNADIANASNAYAKAYLPCALILSSQIDNDLVTRYRANLWIILVGTTRLGDSLASTYAFMKDVIGYDLASFFKRNNEVLRKEVDKILKALLSPETK